MNKRSLIAGVLSVCLMLAMLPAAFAVEQGEANITPQTTMKELRENPSIKGSGYYTYCREMLPKACIGRIRHWHSMQSRNWWKTVPRQ